MDELDGWESEDYLHGLDVGESIGEYHTYLEAKAAYDAGEIELWLEFHKPKSIEDWVEWELEHGTISEFKKRWREES